MTCADVEDFRRLARKRLPRFLFDYVDGGSWNEETLRRNRDDFARLAIRQRVMRDVSDLDLSATFFGQRFSLPIGLGPVGLSGMYARRGEVQAARAAAEAGVPFALSTLSVCALEEIAAGTARPFWFQLYVVKDRGFVADMIARAKACGCTALLLTVDLPVPAVRRRDLRSGLSGRNDLAQRLRQWLQGATHPAWAWDVGVLGRPHGCGNVAPIMPEGANLAQYWAWVAENFDPTVTWKDLDFIRAAWDGPLVIKGILDPADARDAVSAGADGLVVSNHGGRQLDGTLSSIAALPAVAKAVAGRATVLMDGGVRSGGDALKALASGADGVLLGRAWAYALAAQGRAGVAALLQQFRVELAGALAMSGHTSLASLRAGEPILTSVPA